MLLQGSNEKLAAELLSIISVDPDTPRETDVSAILIVGDDKYYIDRVISLDIHRNYNTKYADVVNIEFDMPAGDFIHHVWDKRDTLEMTVTYITIATKISINYKLIINVADEEILAEKKKTISQRDLNKTYIRLQGNLLDKTVEKLKLKTVTGIYRNEDGNISKGDKPATGGNTVGNVIRSVMSNELNLVVSSFGLTPGNVKMVEPNNQRVYDHIEVFDVRAINVPTYLQKKYGVYNGDIGTYYSINKFGRNLYIYPLYRPNLLNYFKRKLVIVGGTGLALAGINSTYVVTEDELKIAVPMAPLPGDDDTALRSNHTGYTVGEALSVMSRPVQIAPDKVKAKKEWASQTKVHTKLKDGSVIIKNYDTTSNQYQHRSKVLKDSGVVTSFKWNFSNSMLLEPMMPVLYMYEVDGKIIRREGILQAVHSTYDGSTKMEASILTVFIYNRYSNKTGLTKLL